MSEDDHRQRNAERARPAKAPLEGIRVIDVSNTFAGTMTSLFLADFGAEVIHVEPPGGSPLRSEAGYPFWGRGKKSIVADLKDERDREVVASLANTSDVFLETFRPGVSERLGLSAEALRGENPRLVHCSITGFGRIGPYASTKGYEGLVMAKIGAFGAMTPMVARPGPAFAAVPYASFGASQAALHGILAALYERECSGLGQQVETSLVQGIAAQDPYYWYLHLIGIRYPEAYSLTPPISDDGLPNSDLVLRGLVGLTADGRWLQFSQVLPHLYRPFMRALGLEWMFDDPEWSSAPNFEDMGKRISLWEHMLEATREKTLSEWQQIFETDHDVWAELFRHGPEILDHPQTVHNGDVIEFDDPHLGPVRQPGPLVNLGVPTPTPTPASRLDGNGDELRKVTRSFASTQKPVDEDHRVSEPCGLPLEGVTVLEFGAFFAAPYGATLLTDLGARVIKVESLAGDPIRNLLPFPETGGAKVLQGKESIALDINTPEGLAIVHELAKKASLVVQSYRAGVATRLRIDADTLRAINPDLVYLTAPAYGVDGPCGDRPAFGITIGAATVALRNAGPSVDERPDLSLEEIKAQAIRLWTATSVGVANADGLSAMGVGAALLLGLLAQKRGSGAYSMRTSMLSIVAHAMSEVAIDYTGKPATAAPDASLFGLSPLYRLYQTADGWIFLAAPAPHEWTDLAAGLTDDVDLAGDDRFATEEARHRHADELATTLAGVFMTRPAIEWEKQLAAADVGCVVAEPGPAEGILMSDTFGRASGFVADIDHPLFDAVPRLAPLVRFSRSEVTAKPGCLLGQHTESILQEIGYSDDRIKELRENDVIAF